MEHWISGSFSILNSKIPEHYKHTNHTSSFSSAESSCLKDLELFVTVPKSSWTKTLASDQTIRVSWTHLVLPKSEDLAKLRCFGGFLCHLLLPLRAIHSSWLIHVCYQRGGGETSQTCHLLLSKVRWKWRRKPLNIPTTAFFPHPLTPFSLWPSDSRQILRGIMPPLRAWKVKVGRSLYLNMVWKIIRKQILDIKAFKCIDIKSILNAVKLIHSDRSVWVGRIKSLKLLGKPFWKGLIHS